MLARYFELSHISVLPPLCWQCWLSTWASSIGRPTWSDSRGVGLERLLDRPGVGIQCWSVRLLRHSDRPGVLHRLSRRESVIGGQYLCIAGHLLLLCGPIRLSASCPLLRSTPSATRLAPRFRRPRRSYPKSVCPRQTEPCRSAPGSTASVGRTGHGKTATHGFPDSSCASRVLAVPPDIRCRLDMNQDVRNPIQLLAQPDTCQGRDSCDSRTVISGSTSKWRSTWCWRPVLRRSTSPRP